MASTLHRSSPLTAKAFIVLSLTQFHVPFYAGRFLPNFMALPSVILAFSLILRTAHRQDLAILTTTASEASGARRSHSRILPLALALLTFTATVVRLELAPLVATVALVLVLQSRLSLVHALIAGAVGGFGGIGGSHNDLSTAY